MFGVQLRKLFYFRAVDCLRLVRCYSCCPPCVNAWSHSCHASSGSGMDNFDVFLVHCQCCHLCNENSGEVLSRKMWHMGKLFLQRWEISILRAKNWLPNKCSVSFHAKVNTQNNVVYRGLIYGSQNWWTSVRWSAPTPVSTINWRHFCSEL